VFAELGSYQVNPFNLATNEGVPERYVGAICDRGFFDVLQVSPLLGRVFTAEEEPAGKDNVLLLGYGVWRQRFGGDPKVIGQKLVVNGTPRTIIGVMPEGFSYPPLTTMWAPLGFDNAARERRDLHRLRVIARLKDGVPLERARSDFQALGVRLAQAYPDLNKDAGIAVNLLLEDLVGQIRPTLLVLLSAVAFVLLIACANVANLLLAKAAGRQREIAIRSSLGAARKRLFRQMLTESLALAIAGGIAGLILAYGTLRGLLALAPANLPRMNQVGLDWRAVGFTLAISVLTGIVFGLVPAWHASRTDLNSLLKEGSRGAGSRSRLRTLTILSRILSRIKTTSIPILKIYINRPGGRTYLPVLAAKVWRKIINPS
jgi:putative ABC transport system permease protein